MNAFLRGFTKVFSGNFYASPRKSEQNFAIDPEKYFKKFPELNDLLEEYEFSPSPSVTATFIYSNTNKKETKRDLAK